MNYFIIFSFVFLCFIPLSPSLSEVLREKNNDQVSKNHGNMDTSSDNNERESFAVRYMNGLKKVKEHWIDPYDMMDILARQERQERQELPSQENYESEVNEYLKFLENMPDENDEPEDQDCRVDDQIDLKDPSSITKPTPLELSNDEKPVFSDIKGDVIGEKMYSADDSDDTDKEIRGLFGKHQHISVLDSIYISRWLKKLISKIETETYEELPGGVLFPMDSVKFEVLKELSTAKSFEISHLDELMCAIIDGSNLVHKKASDWTVYMDCARDLMWPFILAVIMASCIYTLYQGVVYHPFFTFFTFLIILSVFWHWMHLYKQKRAFKHAELASINLPAQCRKHDFGVMEHIQEYIKSFFITNECAKYYEALMVDPFWEVSFTVAASEALASMLVQPLSSGSRVVNLALRQLFEGLSIFIVVPVMMFMFLLLIMMCNYTLRLPFFMGALEPHIPPPLGSGIEDVNPSRNSRRVRDAIRYKSGSNARGMHLRQDHEQDSDPNLGASSSTRRSRVPRNTQHSLPKSDAHSEFKSLGRGHGYGDAGLPCENCSLDQSVSEDDISIIDSEESDSSSENSVDHQSGEFQHCCMCCLSDEMPDLHADCRVCGDNIDTQNAGEAEEMSPEDNGIEDNTEEAPAQKTTDNIPNIQLGAGEAASEDNAG